MSSACSWLSNVIGQCNAGSRRHTGLWMGQGLHVEHFCAAQRVASSMLKWQQRWSVHLCARPPPAVCFWLLAQIQDGLVDHRVGPVVPQIVQVIVKVNQVVIGPALQQGRRDLLCFAPIFKGVTETQTATSVWYVKHQKNTMIYFFFLLNHCDCNVPWPVVEVNIQVTKTETHTMLLLCFSICFHDDRRCARWVRSNSLLICCCPPKQ